MATPTKVIRLPLALVDRLDALAAEWRRNRPETLAALLDLQSAGDSPPPDEDAPTREEAIAILARQARAGKTGAAVALARELREAAAPADAGRDELDELRRSRHAVG